MIYIVDRTVEPALQHLVVSMATMDKCYKFKGKLLSASVYTKKVVMLWEI